jgi:signal transduction histidine kinase
MLRNLVDNALRHGTARQIEIGIAREGNHAVLTVADDGYGVPAAERSQVMQRFRRGTSTNTSGSGLGLSIVQRVVELHGGSLQLDDGIDGRGLAVRVRLPVSTAT